MRFKAFRTAIVSAAVLALAFSVGGAAQAQGLALDFPTDGFADSVNNPNLDDTAGWSFNVNNPVTVTALGLWDEGANGLLRNHEVGLWNARGTLLASTTITNASTPVASASTDGRWLFNSISPFSLDVGTYTVGALFTQDSYDAIRFSASATTDSNLAFVSPEVMNAPAGSGLMMPTNQSPYPAPSMFGPNLLISAGVVAPEPGSVTLAGIALALAVGRFARRKATG